MHTKASARMDTHRKIIHIDMDQFFAAVEQRDNPALRGLPVAVGHDGERGVVSTASYEARRFGVHSAQSIQVAKRLCPELIIVPSHFDRYKEVSAQIRDIMQDYTDLIEPISLDEAFLDVTHNKKEHRSGSRHSQGNQAAHPARDRTDSVCRRFLLQVPGQNRLRLPQAQRPLHHPPRPSPQLHCPPAHRAVLASRQKDSREDAQDGHLQWRPTARLLAARPHDSLWQSRADVLRLRPRHR